MSGGKVADVKTIPAKGLGLGRLTLGQEAIGDPSLVEDLNRP
jgi:hypothetical protein